MAFDFATGTYTADKPATPATPTPKTPAPKASGTFDFATGTYGGSAPAPTTPKPQAEPKESFGHHLLDVGKNFLKNTWETYKATPYKIVEDIEAGAKDIEEGNVLKGVAKAGLRTAADAANAIFAPLSAAIGAVLEETGGQKLVDDLGQVIADRSGISDLPAFQKYAMEHPNAGEDFNRLLTLVMSKGEKGRIDPKAALDEVRATAKKIVTQAESPVPKTGRLVADEYKFKPSPEESVRMAKEKTLTPAKPREQIVTEKIASRFKDTEAAPVERVSVVETPKKVTVAEELPVQTEGSKVTKAATDINDTLVSKGFEKLPESELSKFDPITKQTQIENVTNLMRSSIDDSIAMAKGEKPIVGDVHPQVLFESVKQHAIEQKNYQLLVDLAKSPVGRQLSEAGQTLSAKSFSKIENDPVNAIRSIQKAREAKVERTAKGKTADQAKKDIAKKLRTEKPIKKPSKQSLADFIESIKC